MFVSKASYRILLTIRVYTLLIIEYWQAPAAAFSLRRKEPASANTILTLFTPVERLRRFLRVFSNASREC